MRAPLERSVRRMWRGEPGLLTTGLTLVAAPLSAVFGTVVRLRGFLYDSGVLPGRRGPIPVVSVGNLAVGGTGKTPVAAWLARTLAHRGWKPAIVLRGYGKDEILLHRRWNPGVPVVASGNRVRGVQAAAAEGADIAVLDDGFQHRQLLRDLDLVLLSPEHPLPPRLLPRGPFREPLSALRRAHLVLVTAKGGAELPPAHRLVDALSGLRGIPSARVFSLGDGEWCALGGDPFPPPAGPPLVITSVGSPEPFLRSVLSRVGATSGHLAFADHHAFTTRDAVSIRRAAGGAWIATTEKDAVKLAPFRELLPEVRVLPLVPNPPETLETEILNALEARLRSGTSP
ncbi:MAG: tetraacyldisaccharide 4'-kinase [Gemmatimonadota bacterium]